MRCFLNRGNKLMVSVRSFVEAARRKLVDTSMRNRLLNYTTGKRSTAVEIVGEQPSAIWKTVVVDAKRLQVRATKENERDPRRADEGDAADESPHEDSDFFSELSESLEPRHVDSFLDTNLTADVLDTKLRRLSDVARGSLEEQGVATLFLAVGFLHFFEDDSSDRRRNAPLLLIPASLRRTGNDVWEVRATDDEPLINPALVEYLATRHGMSLGSIGDENFDVNSWLSSLRTTIASKERWRVSAACLVGNFSFQKFVMHEDLKRNADVFETHPIIEMLASRSGQSAGLSSLPAELQTKDLDASFAPETTFQVVDADSTQQRALAAVASGINLVIQGPPGTGKSQTITNLISGSLAAGKSVLFVAEKQAALNVVYDRLRKAGLGDFCLELHSTKANKKALLAELRRAWDASSASMSPEPLPSAELGKMRKALTDYARTLHAPAGPLEMSPFAVIGRLEQLQNAAEVRLPVDTRAVTKSALNDAKELLRELEECVQRMGGEPADHAWAGARLQNFSLRRREVVFDAIDRLQKILPSFVENVGQLQAGFGLEFTTVSSACARAEELAQILASSPAIPAVVLNDSQWLNTSAQARAVIERGQALETIEKTNKNVLAADSRANALDEAVKLVLARGNTVWAWFSSSWRSARRALKAALPASTWSGAFEAAQRVGVLLKARGDRAALDADSDAKRFFDRLWRGANSSWGDLRSWVEWGSAFRETAERLRLLPVAFEQAETPERSVALLRRVSAQARETLSLVDTIRSEAQWPEGHLSGAEIDEVRRFVDRIHAGRERWREMVAFQDAVGRASASVAAAFVAAALSSRAVAWQGITATFERRFLSLWLDAFEAQAPTFARFDGADHASKIEAFRALDRSALETNKQRTATRLRSRTQDELSRSAGETKVLRDQMARTRGHHPVRQLLKNASRSVRAIKPCFLMSPMTVAQTLAPEDSFDLVIFDEASQLTCEDALGAICRGKQLVVVGDPKQLPPTNFFAVQLGETEPVVSEDNQPVFEDLESILELAQAAGFHGAQLRWHYRSRHESLIAYSNQNFYDASLLTFPSVDRSVGHFGLSFDHVVDGIYEGKGTNSKEAAAVVAAVVKHAEEHPHRSLCVGTFSLAQQLRIQDLLDRERQSNSNLDAFLALDRPEPFFVKNLESIQGDERDVVFLSVTYGRTAAGKIGYNLGPLSQQSGWRRLNVLTTRAREKMRVFSSMRADEMSVSDHMRGAVLLRDFLKYAETGVLVAGPIATAMATTESPFEQEVFRALTDHGVQLIPQVGVAGYRIDFGVVDADVDGRFVCGIECDGAAYHSAETARDRDRLREQVLNGLGWELHRLWSTDWWHDRTKQTERLLKLISESKLRARSAAIAPPAGANSFRVPNPPPSPVERSVVAATKKDVSTPVFERYVTSSPARQHGDLVDASTATIIGLCRSVLETEGPIRDDDLRDRLLDAFGHRRAGSKIVERLSRALTAFRDAAGVVQEDAWWWLKDRRVAPRSRRDTAASAEQISPLEYQAAVSAALQANASLTEEALVAVLRDAFGFGAATVRLRSEVLSSLERLTSNGKVVQTSSGHALKHREPADDSRSALPQPASPSSSLIAALREMGLEVVDKTQSGGSLWAIGGEELGERLRKLEQHGARFTFAKNGAGSTSARPAWYWKPN